MKKKITRIVFIITIIAFGLSCKKDNIKNLSDNLNTSDVKNIIREKMGKQNLKEKKSNTEVLFDSKNNNNENQNQTHDPNTDNSDIKEIIESIEQENETGSGFNLDLTEMHPDMIFATIYMIVQDPESVNGKTIKVKGNLYTFPTPDGNSTTQYCVIKDALKCCAQGLNLIPKEPFKSVPADDTEIMVEGTLEPYTVEGVPMTLCRIKDAKVKVLN